MYYSQIRVDPNNPENVYVGGLNFSKSTDGGKTFRSLQADIAHVDNHAIWINPANGNHILVGNDGGLNVSYDQGATGTSSTRFPRRSFMQSASTCESRITSTEVCRTTARGVVQVRRETQAGITNADWYRVGGGDGFYTQIDPTDYNIVYAESQDGNMNRLDLRTGRSVNIRPRGVPRRRGRAAGQAGGQHRRAVRPSPALADSGHGGQLAAVCRAAGIWRFGAQLAVECGATPPPDEPYRFYWNTPIHLSPHNPRVVYAGGNRFFRSLDRGDTWTASADLTKQIDRNTLPIMGVTGNEPMASKHDGYTRLWLHRVDR